MKHRAPSGGVRRVACTLILGGHLSLCLCSPQSPPGPGADAFAGASESLDGSGFLHADPLRRLRFPQDHWPHYGFRSEWWYYTGQLQTEDERRFGLQFTIFKIEMAPTVAAQPAGTRGFMIHAALSDLQGRRLQSFEEIQRDFPGMAGFDSQNDTWFVGLNYLQIHGNEHRLAADGPPWGLHLLMQAQSPPALQGQQGYSPKDRRPGRASHYYSIPELVGEGRLRLSARGEALQSSRVRTRLWMDHEFSSQPLSPEQSGWDWLHLRLNDGRRLMMFRVRSRSGDDFHSGAWLDADQAHPIDLADMRWQATRSWQSPQSGATYPLYWRLKIEDCQLNVEPWFENQEFSGAQSGLTYWEGAIVVRGQCGGQPANGDGYLELTGYAGDISRRL